MSRYSDYNGYWLFGFLVAEHAVLKFDLLSATGSTGSPETRANHLASLKFSEQLRKSGLDRANVREATLLIERLGAVERLVAGGHRRLGFDVRFEVTAIADGGRPFHREAVMFVAPHDASIERQSARSHDPALDNGRAARKLALLHQRRAAQSEQ